MNETSQLFSPGMFVRVPAQPDWGTGQVQSNVHGKITVTFPDAGKLVLDSAHVELVPVFTTE